MMQKMKLGRSDLNVGGIAYGCWRFAESTSAQADEKIRTALEAGMTLIDTADIYGLGESSGFGGAEAVLGNVLAADKSLRDTMTLATKGGIDAVRPYDSSYDYITNAMDASLSRLKTDYVDLYQIHRPDLTTSFEETARALNDMVKAGKARYIGVSNFTPAQTRALQAHLETPIITTQPEFSAVKQSPVTDGTLDLCMEKKMTALLWSPLAGGALATGTLPQGSKKKAKARFKRVMTVLKRLSETYNTDESTIALAFTMGHGAEAIPIIGTQNTNRIINSAKALEIGLSARDFYDVVEAYRGEGMP